MNDYFRRVLNRVLKVLEETAKEKWAVEEIKGLLLESLLKEGVGKE